MNTAGLSRCVLTLRELAKMEKVRSHLLTNNIVDKDSFDDYMSELI